MNSAEKLQMQQFGFLNDFHATRTQAILELLMDSHGDEVIRVTEAQPIDRYNLYYWHTKRFSELLDCLEDAFGEDAITRIVAHAEGQEEENGRKLGNSSNHSFQKLIDHFTGGCDERIIEDTENYVLIKTDVCFAGLIACQMNKSTQLFPHHCGLDYAFVRGFDENIQLDIEKTILNGDAYCLHRIWKGEGIEVIE